MHGHDAVRHVRGARRGARLAALDDVLDRCRRPCPLQLERGRLGQELGLIDKPADAALHQVRADVEEQQQAAQHEERDDEERGHDADEDVGKRQLAADAPQQTTLGGDEQAGYDDADADEEDDAASQIERLAKGGQRATAGACYARGELDRRADEQCAPGKGAGEPLARPERARSGVTRQQRAGTCTTKHAPREAE